MTTKKIITPKKTVSPRFIADHVVLVPKNSANSTPEKSGTTSTQIPLEGGNDEKSQTRK
jgi:hypothetical protein